MNDKFDYFSEIGKNSIWVIILIVVILFIRALCLGEAPSVDEESFKNILASILTASITILTIIFALSQFILQSISTNISSRIKTEYENNSIVILFYFVEIILIVMFYYTISVNIGFRNI